MKKLFFLLVITICSLTLAAQLKITLSLSATPPATLTEWGNRREVLTLLVNGQGSANIPVKIKTMIELVDGTVVATTDLAKAAVYTINSPTTILTAVDVLPIENMIFNGKYKSSLQRTGKLPSDNYMLCVQLVRPVDYAPASEQVCKNFYLAATQLPILMKPYDEEILDGKTAQTAIIFRWTPLVPAGTTPANYHIQVFEILEKQTPVQALRSNQPLLDQLVRGTTQYIWRPQLSFIPSDRSDSSGANEKNINTSEAGVGTGKGGKLRFIWTVQTLDDQGLPVTQTDGSGEARSEPKLFFVTEVN